MATVIFFNNNLYTCARHIKVTTIMSEKTYSLSNKDSLNCLGSSWVVHKNYGHETL